MLQHLVPAVFLLVVHVTAASDRAAVLQLNHS
jgi:hypothetical protein